MTSALDIHAQRDEDAERAARGDGLGDDGRRRRRVGEVGGDGDDARIDRAQLAQHRLDGAAGLDPEVLRVALRMPLDHDLRTQHGEPRGGREARMGCCAACRTMCGSVSG